MTSRRVLQMKDRGACRSYASICELSSPQVDAHSVQDTKIGADTNKIEVTKRAHGVKCDES
jgi:hypothetical protein